jgi:hypothetical protein
MVSGMNKVEAVQRRAARYVANNHRNRSGVSNIIQRLKWRPLADRRKDARLVMLYKIDRESHCNLLVNVRPKYLADVAPSSFVTYIQFNNFLVSSSNISYI